MTAKKTTSSTHRKNITRLAFATALILLVPLVAMRFTQEVNWEPFDFLMAGILLFGTGLTYLLIARRVRRHGYRVMLALGLAVALGLFWAELAVGLFGTPFAGQ